MLLNFIPSIWIAFFYVAVIVALSQAGLTLFRKLAGPSKETASNEVTGIIFGAISLIYSLLLAFIIVAVWQSYEDLERTIQAESDKLNGILAHSATLPPAIRSELNTSLDSYCTQVTTEEWQMDLGTRMDGASAIPRLRELLLTVVPRNNREAALYSILDTDLSSVSELRRTRLNHNRSQLPDLVWGIMKAGSVLLIIFFYFFDIPSLKKKRLYLGFLATYIGMCMYLVYALDRPFCGANGVSSEPYAKIRLELRQLPSAGSALK